MELSGQIHSSAPGKKPRSTFDGRQKGKNFTSPCPVSNSVPRSSSRNHARAPTELPQDGIRKRFNNHQMTWKVWAPLRWKTELRPSYTVRSCVMALCSGWHLWSYLDNGSDDNEILWVTQNAKLSALCNVMRKPKQGMKFLFVRRGLQETPNGYIRLSPVAVEFKVI